MSTYFQTHNLTVSRVPRGGPGAEQGKNCAVVRCGSIPDMIRYIIYIYTMVDHKCHKKYVVDPTWKVKIFIVIIIFVLKNLLI